MLFPSVGVNREDTDILGIICYASCKTEVIYVSSFKKIVVPNQFLLIKCPPPQPGEWGDILFLVRIPSASASAVSFPCIIFLTS